MTLSDSEPRSIRLKSTTNYLTVRLRAVQKEKEAVVLDWIGCIATDGRPRPSSTCYRDACSHVRKRLKEKRVRSKAGGAAAANKAEDEMSHFLRGLVLSMNSCV